MSAEAGPLIANKATRIETASKPFFIMFSSFLLVATSKTTFEGSAFEVTA
jgi:hypothetical protein